MIREVESAGLSADAIVVDVRERPEVDAWAWPGARVRPLSAWGETTIRELVEVARDGDAPLVLVCASGQRSRSAARQLVDRGAPQAKVASLRGGLMRVRAGQDQP